MATVPYVTRQSVREEAGFQNVEQTAPLVGVVDGTNKVFMTEHKPIVDRTYSDTVSTEDVTVYEDGSPVSIDTLDAATGVITLTTAPAADSESLYAFYHNSQLVDTYVDQIIAQATSIVHRSFRSNGITTPFDSDITAHEPYYATIQMIVTLYAAGLALIRDYGSAADTEETSKDGYKKLATAKKELMDLLEALKVDEQIVSANIKGTGGTIAVTNQGRVFSGLNDLTDGEREGIDGLAYDGHEDFFRKP